MYKSVFRVGLPLRSQLSSHVSLILPSNARYPATVLKHQSKSLSGIAQFHIMAKRKRSSATPQDVLAASSPLANVAAVSTTAATSTPSLPSRRQSRRVSTQIQPPNVAAIPDIKAAVRNVESSIRAAPSTDKHGDTGHAEKKRSRKKTAPTVIKTEVESVDGNEGEESIHTPSSLVTQSPAPKKMKQEAAMAELDPEMDEEEDADPEEIKEALSRPPPVNSSFLPLPWKGRLGYACLNTYLRAATTPVFSSRTCRIASILEHRHPLQDPTQPEHATKNRPDKTKPSDVARGQAYVEAICLANVRDIPTMLRWNDKYGIKFFRLSSEMFPFASHDAYGYKLAPFASEALAEAGKVAAELGHRLTTHPGQFTQLGSPRQEVIIASFRDLEYHCELLDLLKLPEQQNRDAVMILHMGGVFGDKAATIARFKENYTKLSPGIKNRLVLENDDVCYTVHDLLPVCEELNIPFVLDYHHHNILFDADKIREGTADIMNLYDRIKATWDRKRITQKMHYSEPTPAAITPRQRRKHSPRVATFPPCASTMDLMIEAKDKEQAVFTLMRTFKTPRFDSFNDVLPYTRNDENKAWKPPKKKKTPKKKSTNDDEVEDSEEEPQPPPIVPEEQISMGGPENRVFWPPGMEEWLRPKKREVKPRDPEKAKTTSEKAAQRRAEKAAWQTAREASAEPGTKPADAMQNDKTDIPKKPKLTRGAVSQITDVGKNEPVYDKAKAPRGTTKVAPSSNTGRKKSTKPVLTPSTSDPDENEDEDDEDLNMPDLTDAEEILIQPKSRNKMTKLANATAVSNPRGRSVKKRVINYAEADDDED